MGGGKRPSSASSKEGVPPSKATRTSDDQQDHNDATSVGVTPLPISHPFQQRFLAPELARDEFHVLDETEASDVEDGDDGEETTAADQDNDEEGSDIDEDELMSMLDEDLPEELGGRRRRGAGARGGAAAATGAGDRDAADADDVQPDFKAKIVVIDKGQPPVEPLPPGWVMVTHDSGMHLYMQRQSRVVTVSRPYYLGPGSLRKHAVPLFAVPCLSYLRALEKEGAAPKSAPSPQSASPAVDTTGTPGAEPAPYTGRPPTAAQCPLAARSAAQQCNGYVSGVEETTEENQGSEDRNDNSIVDTNSGSTVAAGDVIPASDDVTAAAGDVIKDVEEPACASAASSESSGVAAATVDTNGAATEPTASAADGTAAEEETAAGPPEADGTDGAAAVPAAADGTAVEPVAGAAETEKTGAGPAAMDGTDGTATEPVAADGEATGPAASTSTGAAVPNGTNGSSGGAAAGESEVPVTGDTLAIKDPTLTADQLQRYCSRRFLFRTINVLKFGSWKERRQFVRKKYAEERQRPQMDSDTKLFRFPIKPNRVKEALATHKRPREWVFNPGGKSYVCLLHEYLQHVHRVQPVYTYSELESAATPYGATISIDNVQYATGRGTSKKAAKAEAAKLTLTMMLPEMMSQLDGDKVVRGSTKTPDVNMALFDSISVEDPRVRGLCEKAGEPTPFSILLTCLKRNFGVGMNEMKCEVHTDATGRGHHNEFQMTVGKHSARVKCKNKKDGKHVAAQALLQQMHPHVSAWGSLLRMYGNHALKPLQVKRHEEREVTTLQGRSAHSSPNTAILAKLRQEMTKLQTQMEQRRPIGRIQLSEMPGHPLAASLETVLAEEASAGAGGAGSGRSSPGVGSGGDSVSGSELTGPTSGRPSVPSDSAVNLDIIDL